MSGTIVSVAMTTYNSERFVAEQLESFVRQERRPDELIVSDDASTDRTVERVREFARSAPFAVRILVNERNLGIPQNFGRAIGQAGGDIIFLSDADDEWYPQKIRVMARALEETPGAAVVVCDADLVDERLQPLGATAWEAIHQFSPSRRLLRNIARGRVCNFGKPASGCCMAFRGKFKPLVLPLPGGEGPLGVTYDHFIARTIICAGGGGALLLPERLMAYRRHPRQVTSVLQAPAPLHKRLARRLAARRENPDFLRLMLSRAESEEAARLCRDTATRTAVVRHCRARLEMPARFAARVPVVARELAALRYHRISSGWASAAKDLLFARQPERDIARVGGAIRDAAANR